MKSPHKPIPRVSPRKASKGFQWSTAKRSTKPIPKVNVEATKKRRARNAKRMRGGEYQTARRGAIERAQGQCEFVNSYIAVTNHNAILRCEETERLQFHEEHYARGRILTKDDGKMLCPAHHRFLEKQKPHKQHRSGF